MLDFPWLEASIVGLARRVARTWIDFTPNCINGELRGSLDAKIRGKTERSPLAEDIRKSSMV